ncbi:MAG: transaldolase [Acidimicrobiales bacterium]
MSSPSGASPPSLEDLRIKIFADGANIDDLKRAAQNPLIAGFTTNPTLMRKAGVVDYVSFARNALDIVGDRPISFEVFADEPAAMEEQALEIASWGSSVYVKIPVTTCDGATCAPLIGRLAASGVQINVTGVMTLEQVEAATAALAPDVAGVVSVFAGRIADTGRDPVPQMIEARSIVAVRPRAELLWASSREVLNIFQADQAGCHIITLTQDLLDKALNVGISLERFSQETVEMFFRDAAAAGFDIPIRRPMTSTG